MAEGDTGVNALIGAVVTVVASGTMVGPLLGGAVAGYLEGGSRDDGVRVGLFSGLVALVPFLVFAAFAASLLGFVGGGFVGPGHGMFGLGFGLESAAFLFVLLFWLVSLLGLSALGGWLGNHVKYETDIGG